MSSEVYLVSSSDPPRADGLFHGYGFHGSDFVFGDAGARAFREATGERMGSGEDGCYVCVEADGDDFVFKSDYCGYKKVFYLHENGFWAVSNSLHRLVGHLREHGRPVVPNYGQLAAIAGRGPTLCQLTSFATPVQTVALLPVGMDLRIGARGASPFPATPERERPTTYEDALARFVSVWVSRFMTVLSRDGASVESDISGGIDSRAVLGLVQEAAGRLGERAASRPRYKSGTGPEHKDDLPVARSLAGRFGLSLNEDEARADDAPVDGFELWRDLNLGVYHRIRFPTRGQNPHDISVGGGAGENHRPFYAKNTANDSFESFVGSCAGQVRPGFLAPQFEREFMASMRDIEHRSQGGFDPLLLHYRHFRNRFHAGRVPQHRIKLVPLGSRLLEDCAALAGQRRIKTGQVLYDIMASTVPALLDIAFDTASKAPRPNVRKALTDANSGHDLAPGAFHAAPPESGGGATERPERPVDRLRCEFDAAVATPFVAAFCDPDLVARADEVLARAEEVRHFTSAVETQPISAVLAAAMVRP